MNATKRKFNALLQGIGSKSSTPLSTSDSNNASSSSLPRPSRDGVSPIGADSTTMLFSRDPLSRTNTNDSDVLLKRRRLGLPGSTTPGDGPLAPRPANGQTTISNVVLRKWSANGKDEKTVAPKYCPGDRDQLLKRLASFQELTDWTPKPDRVNEVEWAKRGWTCQGKERVRCTLCNKELVVKLNRKEVDGKEVPVLVASEIEEALVEKYAELIVTYHQEDCLWRKRGCDDSLLRLPLANPKTALEGLRQRYDELCARKDFLPYEFNLRLPVGLDVGLVLGYLPKNFFTEPAPPTTNPPSSSPNRTALALAVLGWQGLSNARIGPVPNSASCHTCLRRLGLWMFKSKEVDLETNTVLVPAPMDHLDAVREHRFFCPWKNAAAQKNPGASTHKSKVDIADPDKPGWELLVQVLKNDSYLRNRTTTAHRSAKSVNGPLIATATMAETPGRPTTAGAGTSDGSQIIITGPDGQEADLEDEKARDAKDKERWARLRKVKSLFDTKGSKKLRKTVSRPGTGHDSIRGGD